MKIPKAKKMTSGNWYIRLRLGGESISVIKPTEREAVAEAAAIKAGVKSVSADPLSMTVGEAYSRYISAKEAVLSASTIAGYRRLSKNTFQNLMPAKLRFLTIERIQREVSDMHKAGKSAKYIANASGLLSAVLKMFYPEFRYNPMLPQREKPQLRTLSDAEIGKIVNAVRGTSVELPTLMAIWMGMRMSEILGAKYGDITDKGLHIQRALVLDIDGKAVEKKTKTSAGNRTVEIPAYIRQLMGDGSKGEHIVRQSGQTIYKRFCRILESAGVDHCRFHDLRHANAAVMVRLGIESKYAQERNGWASDRMYKQVYAYTMDDTMEAVNFAIDNYFANKIGK